MRQGPSGRRPRSRHHSGNGGNGGGNGGNGGSMGGGRSRSAASLRHQSFDSNCGDLRVRGNAWQVYEKYQALARDVASGGDRVSAENYLQHAEHYFRIIEAIDEAAAAEQRIHPEQPSTFAQQPEVPANYYTQEPAASGEASAVRAGNAQSSDPVQKPMGEATVQSRTPPAQQSSPFYTQEEIDAQNEGDQPLAIAR